MCIYPYNKWILNIYIYIYICRLHNLKYIADGENIEIGFVKIELYPKFLTKPLCNLKSLSCTLPYYPSRGEIQGMNEMFSKEHSITAPSFIMYIFIVVEVYK